MEALISQWQRNLESLGLANGTVSQKVELVRGFAEMMEIDNPEALAPEHIERYHHYVYGRGLKAATIRIRLTAVRDFIRYLRKSGLTLLDPDGFRFPPAERSLPKFILSEEQVAAMFKVLSGRRRYYRRRAVVELLYATGIRHRELLNLDTYDVNLQERTLWVRQGKAKKDRVVPVTKSAARAVQVYLREVRSRFNTSCPALFLDRRGRERVSSKAVTLMLFLLGRRIGLGKPLGCHVFRHSIATHLLRRGVDIRYIQAFLGHEYLSTTQIYTRVVPADLKNGMEMHHPRERMKV